MWEVEGKKCGGDVVRGSISYSRSQCVSKSRARNEFGRGRDPSTGVCVKSEVCRRIDGLCRRPVTAVDAAVTE